ncbi:MAG: hypothetical protein IPF94_12925 [Betaproteobacteria bacterium]|nr:hypothetical protein [Betaproteobacteria bacterium]
MANHKSLTEAAMRKRREARYERDFKTGAPLAPMFERQAAELLKLETPPDVGPGGEVVNEQVAGLGQKRWNIRETLREGADRIAEDASLRRTDLLMQPSFNVVAMGIDAAEAIGASNSLEKMLAHQMAVAHEGTMRLMDRALSFESSQDAVESCRLANTAARLMGVFQDGLLTLQRLRTGGSQTVTVQHVNVQSGAQAVIGMATGGRKRGGRNGKVG